ncbi:hypothetical protein NIES4101_62320 [Calothrix sp. NIES-4101]|nr:hypothetical protein NIES4101_62320 [Calothrix sp. NIES-4101]
MPGQKILSGNFAKINRYVEDIEQVNSISLEDSHEDNFSGGAAEEVEVVSTSDKQNKSEIREICTELKRLRINPEQCLGVIKKHWENVAGALARVKEAINEGWCNNPTGLFKLKRTYFVSPKTLQQDF